MAISKQILDDTTARLREKLAHGRVVTDPEILETYGADETPALRSVPDLLVRAENTDEVRAVLEICNELGVPVVPRGAGTGVTGGAVPIRGGVVLSLEKMNRILEIDRENMVAVVEPGVITGVLQKEALAEGLMYPPDPASLETCSIGGNIAEIAGGPRAVKYGTTKDYVLGLECVLPDGSLITTGGKYVKNATGYNITGIILGSEGTLAVVTKIFLRLIPAPAYSMDLLVPYGTIGEAIDDVYRILTARVVPATIEFMERDAIAVVSEHLKGEMPFPDAGAHLLIQIDGDTEESVLRDIERLGGAITADMEQVITAESPPQRERMWKARRSIREAIQAMNPEFIAEDCVVPRSRIPEFLKAVKQFLSPYGLKSIMFGHAGDGNVHIDTLKGDMDPGRWKELIPELKRGIYGIAIAMGGTITGEHGIGCLRKEYLGMAMNPASMELHRRIKKAFDPNMILNPGKII